MELYIVDAFTDKPFCGNTAGVVLCEELDTFRMQNLASELRFSETAFITRLSPELFGIKYFTSTSEIELCGHATIASFKVLLHKGIVQNYQSYKIETLAGILPVHIQDDLLFMESNAPKNGPFIAEANIKKLCSVLGISVSDVGDYSMSLKPEIISTGLYDIMLPIKTTSALAKINPNYKKLSKLSKELSVVGVHAFTLDADRFTAKCRNFAPLYGIDEEAATGTSNASLTYYLYKNNVIKDLGKVYMFSQGDSMGKPSRIFSKISDNKQPKILIGGNACIVSEGNLFI
ncbi:PhzF family phenazine biosynthesis protein [Clostridium swellfunianum]|uniref:PhzF family phenazine biosynthesis protein n=1 Tax=Clostridium swellfunianum TaxID=1367462 RepID=UPI00202F4DA9|nr:PhzF family phenazine biosynthesis protein [Clostridium swellfunianum]MCM0650710.1 PhzF family phenazine biosynthesis protein [Clostridium swellfunianum]